MFLKKVQDTKFFLKLNDVIKSPIFLGFYLSLLLISIIFGLDLIFYTFTTILLVITLLFLKDTYIIAALACVLYFSPSIKNNPGLNGDSIFYPHTYLYYIIFLMVVIFSCAFIRIFINIKYDENINKKRPKLLWGFLILGLSYLISGIGYPEYTFNNLLFALVEILSLSLCYFVFYYLIDFKRVKKSYIGYISLLAVIFLSAQLIYVYIDHNVIQDGVINRGRIYFGWGHYNNLGGSLCFFIPGIMYLAYLNEHKYSFIYIIIAGIFTLSLYFVQSRTALAVGFGLYFISLLLFIFKGNKANKITSIIIMSIGIIGFIVLLIFKNEYLMKLIDALINFKEDSGGRMSIYKNGIENFFLKYPIFGTGFYSCNAYKWGSQSYTFIPARWHDTYVQLLASCGIVGLCAYLYHRYETIKLLIKNPSFGKVILYICIIGLIGTSILDCHFFNLGPGLFYGVYLLFIEKYEDYCPKEQVK